MILLTLLLERQAEVAKLITTLARVQMLSLSRLAINSQVQKASLLRYCKGQEGGYLSTDARDRVLKVLGWEKGGLTPCRVHVWQLNDAEDARFLLGTALERRARLTVVAQSGSTRRLAVGVWNEVPLVIATDYAPSETNSDPLVTEVAGSFEPARSADLDARALDAARQSPKAFFRLFGPRDELSGIGPSADIPAGVRELLALGFSRDEINAMAEDFLSRRCRSDPSEMEARYERYFQSCGSVVPSSPAPDWLKRGIKMTARNRVTELAERRLKEAASKQG